MFSVSLQTLRVRIVHFESPPSHSIVTGSAFTLTPRVREGQLSILTMRMCTCVE